MYWLSLSLSYPTVQTPVVCLHSYGFFMHADGISMEMPMLYFKVLAVKFYKMMQFRP